MNKLPLFTATALVLALALPAQAEQIFIDSFESGDMSATSKDGFDWQRNNRTSVVTEEAVVYNNGEKYNPPKYGEDWSAFHGDHSLRFRYPAGEAMAEQRFRLGSSYPDIWFQYWVRVPTNYTHGSSNPSNHKLFALWMDDYSSKGLGPTIAWEFWGTGGGSSNLAFHYSEGGYEVLGGHKQYTDFISVPSDRGRWMELTIHIKASSSGSSSDGVIELWRRWESESPDDRELLHRTREAVLPFPSGGPNGWAAGYFMGWANAAYSQDTEWLIDHITISTESLLDTDGVSGSGNAPNPPVLQISE
ncbi:hypothetical protein [Marinobacter sp.]|uniref:hypothetical protein n=1 Tax=Marinobacter sp. TaxID=50741 RepID=UPI0034A4A977